MKLKPIRGAKRPSITKETNVRLRLLSSAISTSMGCLIEYFCDLGFSNISQMTEEELKKDIQDRLAKCGILHTRSKRPNKMYREEVQAKWNALHPDYTPTRYPTRHKV